jgi:hypothetical protein
MAVSSSKYTREETLYEFEWTRTRHKGSILTAAPMLGMNPKALAQALYRARKAGVAVSFTDDLKQLKKVADRDL